ncbi:MAG: RteC domain-containing protein, partial [Bacteroidetes bacterium]|nr:RteC domain-containing protein [Bacteroidota bacterium]
MEQTHYRVLSDMESFMSKYTHKNSYSLEEKEQIIIYLVNLYKQLKNHQSPLKFQSQQEEIHYFKNVKPLLISKLILYAKLYKMESEKPNLCTKATYKYYKRELLKLNHYFEDNREFYAYYKTKSTYLDKRYFLRNRHNIRLRLEPYLIDFNLE